MDITHEQLTQDALMRFDPALGTEGYDQMATPEEQAEHEAAVRAHHDVLARLEEGKRAYEAMKQDARMRGGIVTGCEAARTFRRNLPDGRGGKCAIGTGGTGTRSLQRRWTPASTRQWTSPGQRRNHDRDHRVGAGRRAAAGARLMLKRILHVVALLAVFAFSTWFWLKIIAAAMRCG